MKTKFIAFSLIIVGMSSIACRQDEVLLEQEEALSSVTDAALEVTAKKDSTFQAAITDPPPKDKDHWKIALKDSIDNTPPKSEISNFGISDVSINPIDDSGPKDTPKDKDHWKAR